MEYKKWYDTSTTTSLLGFGCMRFNLNDKGEVDENIATKLITKAYENGVNYFDTAMPYLNGKSEPFVGKVLDRYPRDTYYLATKLTLGMVKTEEVDTILDKQLKTLNKDYIDFYLLHALNKKVFERIKEERILEKLIEWKKQGKIRNIGFSFHDDSKTFFEILNYFNWDFVQLQINYIDINIQQGMDGYLECEKRKIPIVVMEPAKGGKLSNFHPDAQSILLDYKPHCSLTSFAMRYVGSLPGVKCILSGMNQMDQLDDNLKTFNNFEVLNATEYLLIEQVKKKLKTLIKVGCTSCKYCIPCPKNVDIPANFNILNDYFMYKSQQGIRFAYSMLANKQQTFLNCIDCKKCVPKCPQAIDIPNHLKEMKVDLNFLIDEK